MRPIYEMRHARPRTPRFCSIFGPFFSPSKMAKNDQFFFRQNHPNGIFLWFECIFDTFKGRLLSLAANSGQNPRKNGMSGCDFALFGVDFGVFRGGPRGDPWTPEPKKIFFLQIAQKVFLSGFSKHLSPGTRSKRLFSVALGQNCWILVLAGPFLPHLGRSAV